MTEKYQVTWKHVDTGNDQVHVSEFDDVDQGYDFYQMKRRDAYCYKVTWDHIRPGQSRASAAEQ